MIPWRLIVWLGLVAALAGAGWYIKGLITDNEQLRQQVDQWQTNYDSLNTIWQQERDALSEREATYQDLAKRSHTLSKKLSEVLSHASQKDSCVFNTVPPAVDQRLRELYRQAVPKPP